MTNQKKVIGEKLKFLLNSEISDKPGSTIFNVHNVEVLTMGLTASSKKMISDYTIAVSIVCYSFPEVEDVITILANTSQRIFNFFNQFVIQPDLSIESLDRYPGSFLGLSVYSLQTDAPSEEIRITYEVYCET